LGLASGYEDLGAGGMSAFDLSALHPVSLCEPSAAMEGMARRLRDQAEQRSWLRHKLGLTSCRTQSAALRKEKVRELQERCGRRDRQIASLEAQVRSAAALRDDAEKGLEALLEERERLKETAAVIFRRGDEQGSDLRVLFESSAQLSGLLPQLLPGYSESLVAVASGTDDGADGPCSTPSSPSLRDAGPGGTVMKVVEQGAHLSSRSDGSRPPSPPLQPPQSVGLRRVRFHEHLEDSPREPRQPLTHSRAAARTTSPILRRRSPSPFPSASAREPAAAPQEAAEPAASSKASPPATSAPTKAEPAAAASAPAQAARSSSAGCVVTSSTAPAPGVPVVRSLQVLQGSLLVAPAGGTQVQLQSAVPVAVRSASPSSTSGSLSSPPVAAPAAAAAAAMSTAATAAAATASASGLTIGAASTAPAFAVGGPAQCFATAGPVRVRSPSPSGAVAQVPIVVSFRGSLRVPPRQRSISPRSMPAIVQAPAQQLRARSPASSPSAPPPRALLKAPAAVPVSLMVSAPGTVPFVASSTVPQHSKPAAAAASAPPGAEPAAVASSAPPGAAPAPPSPQQVLRQTPSQTLLQQTSSQASLQQTPSQTVLQQTSSQTMLLVVHQTVLQATLRTAPAASPQPVPQTASQATLHSAVARATLSHTMVPQGTGSVKVQPGMTQAALPFRAPLPRLQGISSAPSASLRTSLGAGGGGGGGGGGVGSWVPTADVGTSPSSGWRQPLSPSAASAAGASVFGASRGIAWAPGTLQRAPAPPPRQVVQ